MGFWRRLFMSKQQSKLNAVANVIGYEKSGGIRFLLDGGRITGIWVRAFPDNTSRRHFLSMFCASKQEGRAYERAASGSFTVSKAASGEGFDIRFRD